MAKMNLSFCVSVIWHSMSVNHIFFKLPRCWQRHYNQHKKADMQNRCKKKKKIILYHWFIIQLLILISSDTYLQCSSSFNIYWEKCFWKAHSSYLYYYYILCMCPWLLNWEKNSDIYYVIHCTHLAVECLFLHEIICGWH